MFFIGVHVAAFMNEMSSFEKLSRDYDDDVWYIDEDD